MRKPQNTNPYIKMVMLPEDIYNNFLSRLSEVEKENIKKYQHTIDDNGSFTSRIVKNTRASELDSKDNIASISFLKNKPSGIRSRADETTRTIDSDATVDERETESEEIEVPEPSSSSVETPPESHPPLSPSSSPSPFRRKRLQSSSPPQMPWSRSSSSPLDTIAEEDEEEEKERGASAEDEGASSSPLGNSLRNNTGDNLRNFGLQGERTMVNAAENGKLICPVVECARRLSSKKTFIKHCQIHHDLNLTRASFPSTSPLHTRSKKHTRRYAPYLKFDRS